MNLSCLPERVVTYMLGRPEDLSMVLTLWYVVVTKKTSSGKEIESNLTLIAKAASFFSSPMESEEIIGNKKKSEELLRST